MSNTSTLTDGTDLVTVDTRFGVFEFDRNLCIRLPRGLLGFNEYVEYGLTAMPNEKLAPLMLLQSIEDAGLTFIVRPYDESSALLDAADVSGALKDLSIDPTAAAILLITTFHKTPEGLQQSVNLRAPIFVDSDAKKAWQYIFRNDRYDVRHTL